MPNSPRDRVADANETNKVAQVTFAFWIMKICATTLGETAGDLLSMTLGIGYALSTLVLLAFFFSVRVWWTLRRRWAVSRKETLLQS